MTDRFVPGERVHCEACSAHVVVATTVASPLERAGRTVLLQLAEHPAGEYAVTEPSRDRAVARRLEPDEAHDPPLEYRGLSHAPRCIAHPIYADITEPRHLTSGDAA